MVVSASPSPPQAYEDADTRFSAPAEASNRGLWRRYIRKIYTLTSGPNSGKDVEYFQEDGPQLTGAAATDAPVSGNPVLIAARASTAVPAAMSTDGDAVPFWATRNGRLHVSMDRPGLRGIYHSSAPISTVTLGADAATAGRFWLINPVASGVLLALREVRFNNGAGLIIVTTTTPQFTLERMTFTGTASGGTVTPALRDSTDSAPLGSLRSASTGLTPAAGAVVNTYSIPEVATAAGTNTNTVESIQYPEDARIVLRPGEGLVFRQATAGTLLDTRWVQAEFVWEEFTTLGAA